MGVVEWLGGGSVCLSLSGDFAEGKLVAGIPMRFLFIATSLALSALQPAKAETPDPTPVSLTEHARASEAARALFASATSDDYLLDQIEEQVRASIPAIVERTRGSAAFQSYTPEHQAALLAAFDTVPAVFRGELARELEAISDRVAPRFAELMSADEFLAAAAAIREPENQPLLRAMVLSSFSGLQSQSSFPDLSLTPRGAQFLASETGQRFQQIRPQLDQIVAEESLTLATLGGRMSLIGMAIACDALEDECPAATRQRLGRL